MESTAETVDQVVAEIMRLHRSLPPRPSIDECDAATSLVQNVDKEDQARLDAISSQKKKSHVISEELFSILQEMQRGLVFFHSRLQKHDALKLLDLENLHVVFDDLILRASSSVSSSPSSSSSATKTTTTGAPPALDSGYVYGAGAVGGKAKAAMRSRDDSYVASKSANTSFYSDAIPAVVSTPRIADASLSSGVGLASSAGEESEKLSLIKLASLIEVFAKKGAKEVDFRSKLHDQIEWLPDSIGKLSSLLTLDISENRLLVLPSTVGGMSSLTKLDLHSNRLAELPDSIGYLNSLVSLDLRANNLASLPATFGRLARLEELDLSSNRLALLPDTIGSLTSLKVLNVETNEIDEIPHSIGRCASLKELHADYNKLKALPEAVGKIETLEILSVRYNNIKQLPTTMSSLLSLRELDVSFNELESVPESLCFATTLVKMNIGNNFADMRSLPRSIGNLEMLEELDMSNNQIRVLPESFRMLTRLRVLRAEENPLEVPPRHIADKGAQAVVQYMVELVQKRDVVVQPAKQKNCWAQCFFSGSNKRKRNGTTDHLKT